METRSSDSWKEEANKAAAIEEEEYEEDDQDEGQEDEEEEDQGVGFCENDNKKERGPPMTSFSRRRVSGGGGGRPTAGSCQAEDCTADMSSAKQYHRRHKVCEFHAKAEFALVAGSRQRFCQQCSRFIFFCLNIHKTNHFY